MKKGISDQAAIAFSVGFYKALGANYSVEEAYRFGIVELKLLNIPEHLVPVLIKRETNEQTIASLRDFIENESEIEIKRLPDKLDVFERVATRDEVEAALHNTRQVAIQQFLSENRGLIAQTLGYSNDRRLGLVLSNFALGGYYVPDFIAFFWDSNIFRVNLIKLEGVSDPVITKAGTPSEGLSSALREVADWKRMLDNGSGSLVLSLRQTIWEYAPNHLADFFARHWVYSDTRYEFTVFIGRSSSWDAESIMKINSLRAMYDRTIKICSYDRFARYASKP